MGLGDLFLKGAKAGLQHLQKRAMEVEKYELEAGRYSDEKLVRLYRDGCLSTTKRLGYRRELVNRGILRREE